MKRLSREWIRELRRIDVDFSITDDIIFDDAYEMYLKYRKPIISNEQEPISSKRSSIFTLLRNEIIQEGRDLSNSNGASIAFILEYKNIKLLFLGDAHEDVVLEGLLKYKELENTLDFDLVKLSHHGSLMNNFCLLEKVTSENYLISTNGKRYGHPDIGTIAKIIKSNHNMKKIYFNYPHEFIQNLQNETLKKEFNYNIIVGDGKDSIKIEVNTRVK